MPFVEIEIKGIKEALAALGKVDSDMTLPMTDAIAEEVVLPRLREYPPASRAKQPFKSDKSRRFFFAALKRGDISVPYHRTSALAALWETKHTSLSSLDIVSRRKKSDLIIGDSGKQAAYHRGTWPTVDQVAEESTPDALEVADRIAREYIDRAGLA